MRFTPQIIIILSCLVMESSYAKLPYTGDIVGRDLSIPGMGWLGHVGIMLNFTGSSSYGVIEVLNEAPVIQINNLVNFKSKSAYWGSRYGIGDYGARTDKVITEAAFQKILCPKYTSSTSYQIGIIDESSGKIIKCGMWRCDTFVAWSFFSAGYYDLMNLAVMLPRNVFNTFPYTNGDQFVQTDYRQLPMTKDFKALSADDLNNMPYKEFSRVADIPLQLETPEHIASEWKYAGDMHINDTKRGIFIDRLSLLNEQNTISKFIELYKNEKSPEIKSKLIQATVIYYQNHLDQLTPTERNILSAFYANLLAEKLTNNNIDSAIRGYVAFHTPHEILEHRSIIDNQLTDIEPSVALGLKLELMAASKELEAIYLPSAINLLKTHSRSDLDSMFFTLIEMRFNNLSESSKSSIKDYLNATKSKYLSKHSDNQEDLYFTLAKQSFTRLDQKITKGMR